MTTQRLQQMGLETCSDIQLADYHVLIDRFGKIGHRIWQFSQGIDERLCSLIVNLNLSGWNEL